MISVGIALPPSMSTDVLCRAPVRQWAVLWSQAGQTEFMEKRARCAAT